MSFVRTYLLAFSALILAGCSDNQSAEKIISAFCQGVKVGQFFDEVKAQYSSFGLQSGGFAPLLNEQIQDQERHKISSTLVQSPSSRGETRPACAIYYSNIYRGGDDKIVLVEFKPAWGKQH